MNIQIIRILIEFTSTNFTDYSNNRLKKCKISIISSFVKTFSYSCSLNNCEVQSIIKSNTNNLNLSLCNSISNTMNDIKDILE
jgi:hypothetical protein